VIEIRGLRKQFGHLPVLEGITASIEQGEFAVLLGSNGAGKTTLLRCVLGLLAYEGSVTVGGCDVARDGRAARRLIGYVPQRPALPSEATCSEVLDLFARLRGLARGDASWLARVGLDAQGGVAVGTLSGGMRQRLALAVALQADPAIVLFDEPAAHLDTSARRALHRDLLDLAGRGRTIVLSTHLAAEPLQAASRALVLDRGCLVYDGPADGLRAAVQQRVIFTLNGTGRADLLRVLDGMPGVRYAETPSGVVAATGPGGAFELLAAVAAAGLRPVEVHVEEPSVDTRRLAVLRGAAAP
jgi:ABC-type multidrug transport system ATPase subunit